MERNANIPNYVKAMSYFARAARAEKNGNATMARQCAFLADYFAWLDKREELGKANKTGSRWSKSRAMSRLNERARMMRQSFANLQR